MASSPDEKLKAISEDYFALLAYCGVSSIGEIRDGYMRLQDVEAQHKEMLAALKAIQSRISDPMTSARHKERIVHDISRWCAAAIAKAVAR